METGARTAAVVVIGDEILSGKYTDENAAFLIKELRELGVGLRRIVMIPDVLSEIADTVRWCAERHDVVFTSGGVGPTHDDLTMEGIARAFDVPVIRHAELDRMLRTFYGPAMDPRNLRMADVPDGAELVAADHPMWPVTRFKNIYILPGVPVIFRRKFLAIRERFRGSPFHVRRVYCMTDEGSLATHLDAVVAEFPGVGVGSYPRFGEPDYRVVVTFESKDASLADQARDALVGRLPAGVLVRTE